MADKKITELPSVVEAGITPGTDVIPIVTTSDGITKKATIADAVNAVIGDITLGVLSVNSRVGDVVLTKSDVNLDNVDNTSDATKNSAVATLTNKTLTSPTINTPTIVGPSISGATITTSTLTSPTITTPTITSIVSGAGTSTLPTATGTILSTAAPVTVAQGGTGVQTLTAYAPMFGGTTATGPVQSGTVGSSGQVLMSNGPAALPTFQALPTVSGGTLITTLAAATSASLIDTTSLTSSYNRYELRLIKLVPASGSSELRLAISTDNGATWAAGSSDYVYTGQFISSTGTATANSGAGTSKISLTSANISSSQPEGVNGSIFIQNPSATTSRVPFISNLWWPSGASANSIGITAGWLYNTVGAITAIRFIMSTGNITSGSIQIWGYQ